MKGNFEVPPIELIFDCAVQRVVHPKHTILTLTAI